VALETGQVTKQQKIMLAVLAVAGLYMLYTKAFAPLGDKIKASMEQLQKKEAELMDMRMQAQQLDLLEKELKLFEEYLKKTEEKLPKTEEIPQLIRIITETAAKYGIDVEVLNKINETNSKYYTIHPYGMEFESDFHTIGRLFSEIGQLERIFSINDASFEISKDEKEKNSVKVKFMLLGYTFKQ